jgi:hypothetical protein
MTCDFCGRDKPTKLFAYEHDTVHELCKSCAWSYRFHIIQPDPTEPKPNSVSLKEVTTK